MCWYLSAIVATGLLAGASVDATTDSIPHTQSLTTSTAKWEPHPPLPRNSSKALAALFQAYSPDTPVFLNHELANRLASNGTHSSQMSLNGKDVVLDKKALPLGTCAPGTPCTNGACCSKTGVCSYAPSSCAPKNCISNCDAKAPCGQYAAKGEGNCPLNVCCSEFGFCGTTTDFCGKGCQKDYGSCEEVKRPSCLGNSANGRRIGYYEGWAGDPSARPCDRKLPTDLDLTGLTHLNFAFAFFDPKSFSITPMTDTTAKLYKSFTGLKDKHQWLETWISIGGWSFNNDGNNPDTRTAFSRMVGSAANRRAFISSLENFMQTYGFNGVDIDWEYPAAHDRGGVAADTGNLAELVAEMRAAWGKSYGITATLPLSYWYLQGFDVKTMQEYVDWFNVMSYDIHGVWDANTRFQGQYIRPHTNLTEIKQGLDLLWMAGVAPEKVTLGVGWYGRSFTLADPSCSQPNGVCQFTEGGKPGRCTNSAGTLSIAEIKAIIASGAATQYLDSEAAVRWMTWDNNQWVSYDDGATTLQKIQAANSLCLGGIMIWALDQDNSKGSAMNDLLGIGEANGVSEAAAREYKEQLNNATLQSAIASSCYWTLCDEGCNDGYFDVTEAKGQVTNVQKRPICSNGQLQTLCCAPGTTVGKCEWEGFRGVGLPCTPVCSDPEAAIVARNSNSYTNNEFDQLMDLTCTGGYQAFCCSGFVPSSKTNTKNKFLYGQGIFNKLDLARIKSRDLAKGARDDTLTVAICAAAVGVLIAAAPFTSGLSLIGISEALTLCHRWNSSFGS
ncbi:killer toxin alpha/beta [Nannizzia gypsea CBS 118893]|uniref:chitinase n=1 Tax=Arthroderma gypseum (strain ATCC MYA-4604 / CBS 118893) TaxID=535722 RepID=E4V771_ARTGP|nr:killer toxin alpha/beta [Nannizzia gypsea CBS 118893]EFQ96937.1 killer toxin alpha/beta [Nannizzia gypsea CBS 118893]